MTDFRCTSCLITKRIRNKKVESNSYLRTPSCDVWFITRELKTKYKPTHSGTRIIKFGTKFETLKFTEIYSHIFIKIMDAAMHRKQN